MSFILDALRKSEHERQRQTGPALVDTPVAAPKPKSNTWAVAAIALLVVNLVAIGGLLLFKSREEPAAAAAPPPATGTGPAAPAAAPAGNDAMPAPAAQASITQTAPQPAPVAPPPMLRPAAEPAYAPGSNPLEREVASAPAMESEVAAAAAAPPPGPAAVQATRRGSVVYQELPEAGPITSQAGAPPPASSAGTGSLPTADEFVGRGVPEMRLELHFYATRPQERFVFVNGHRYREGETTAEGVTVVEIVPEGVVMNLGGNRFLLPRP
jgi:general secretion pathway protein B